MFRLLVFSFLAACANAGFAVEPIRGPIVNGYGPAFAVEDLEVPVDNESERAVVMDVLHSKPEGLNPFIESAARYLNMHGLRGVPADKMKVALVVHGPATFDVLSDKAHEQRRGAPNPNSGLLTALVDAGVDIYLCGQSAGFNGISGAELHPGVQLGLSAMTMFETLQAQGYRLLP